MGPFQLDFPIPEIGAEVGDWIIADDDDDHVQLVRAVPMHRVRAHLSRMTRLQEMVAGRGGGLEVVR